MSGSSKEPRSCDLLAFRDEQGVNNVSQFCDCIGRLDLGRLTEAYERCRAGAPDRHFCGKKYFGDRSGFPSGDKKSNRNEEHLAMALFNDFAALGAVDYAGLSALRLLDYQFPLKSKRADRRIGKVDLFAVIDDAHPCVIELKVASGNGKPGTPLFAFLEALAYCAVVEANMNAIAEEAQSKHQVSFTAHKPRLMVLAPMSYWEKYIQHKKAGDWRPRLQELADAIVERVGVRSHFAALRGAGFSMGSRDVKPRLDGKWCLESAW